MTDTVKSFRKRLSELKEAIERASEKRKLEQKRNEALQRQNEILLRKKYILVRALSDHYRQVQECDNSECDFMVVTFDGLTQNGDETSKKCNFCSQIFCQKHFDSHTCNYGCSGV
ncbi:MAG: hypothetical protein H0U27_08285 [Nitrosopumilus sp.]|nr:hypothetical protein [Nitrosopumilus sp.]